MRGVSTCSLLVERSQDRRGREKMAKRMSYTTAFKLKVVDLAIKNGNRSAGREYGVNEKLVSVLHLDCRCASFRVRLILQ